MSTRPWSVALLALGPAAFVAAGLALESADALAPLKLSIQRTPGSLPSSLAVSRDEVARGAPLVSLYAEHETLFDPQMGLLTNLRRPGRAWEVPAMFSYFDQGRLVIAGGVGLRVHGSNSGARPQEQSFRLDFRREYGLDQFMPGVLFGGQSDPITRLVVHNDRRHDGRGRWWHLVNPLAYDIARQIGAVTPNTQPVRFFINGEFLGIYVLTEHIRTPFLRSRYGHSNFIRTDAYMLQALRLAVGRIAPLTMAGVDDLIDVENLSRWFVSILFCATTDPFQAVLLQDATQTDARWFWVNWDMDQSFMGTDRQTGELARHDTFETTLNHRIDALPLGLSGVMTGGHPALESEILTRLIADDPVYRKYLTRLVTETLNHRVTEGFLSERFNHYRATAERLGVGELEYLEDLQWFLVLRAHEVRSLVTQYLGAGPAYRYELDGPDGVEFEIDGHRVTSGFRGWYFEDAAVTVRLTDRQNGFSHWMVNDRPVRTTDLTHRITADTTVMPVFTSD